MFDEVDDLDAPGALRRAGVLRREADAREAELVAVAAHWADLHAVLPHQEAARFAVPGMETLVRLAGPGTPEVAEFAPAELGAALGMTTFAASCLVGDALELRHRLPRVWARVLEGRLPAWRARRIADHTKALSAEAADWVDAQVVGFAHKIGIGRVLRLVAAAMWTFDPEEAARLARERQQRRRVAVTDETGDGCRQVHIDADALDVARFDATLTAIADALGQLGDADRMDLRRAKAVGVIADPQATLDLLAAAEAGDPDDSGDPGDSGDPDVPDGARDGARARSSRTAWPRSSRPVLYVHLHADAVAEHRGAAMARIEGGQGPVAVEQVMEWLGRGDMVVQPVLDLADGSSVDAYEAPPKTREVVVLTNPCCPFPWCNNLSRTKDADHVKAYVLPAEGGPPGQTGPHNLAHPCRRHHRLKTHGGWSYTMPEPGVYLWRSPLGQRFLVDTTGTTPLARAPGSADAA